MTVLENIELCDNGCTEVRELTVAQKIRLRTPSYGTISAQYQNFLSSQAAAKMENEVPKENNNAPSVQSDIEIVSVVALNPRIAEMLMLLEMQGRIKSDGYKALKIKPTMHANMEKNAEYKKVQEETARVLGSNIQGELEEPSTELIEMAASEESKVSKNGVTAAKIEKFATVMEETKETVISPLVVEEQNARPVSREVPLVAPERELADTQQQKEDILPTTKDGEINQVQEENLIEKDNLPDNITDLAAIKEYLEKTARLKREAEQAKEAEAEAKMNAEKAEQEAADRRDEFRKTAERIAAHQEELIAQKEKSQEQATMYDNKRGEYESESAEYQKAINDMLALIGDSKEDSKGKVM